MRSSKKLISFALIALIFVACFAVYLGAIAPLKNAIKVTDDKIRYENRLAKIYRHQKQVKHDLPNSEETLPVNPDVDQLINRFEAIESESKCHIVQINFNGATDAAAKDQSSAPTALKSVDAELSVASPDYDHMLIFLRGLETSSRKIIIHRVTFPSASNDQAVSGLPFDVKISAYYYE
ncbi:hypothetical protein ACFO4N_15735 [Camelliibacillus cellulosilyticus]|uniref:Type IV pilus assembly protein PilO n=1 Tax=Camelliibacillus cellulosilyticus TaxID=2174486 RepID=A0ABV9GSL5_9BACL